MPSVRYRCAGVTVEADRLNATLLDVSITHKITHWHECGGHGRCTTCRVRILDGASHLSAPTRREVELAQARGWDPTIRLACQTYARGDVTLERIVLSEASASQLQTETFGREAGAERQLAILFCDMRDFTALADANSAFDVVHILNRFFEALGEPILLNGGVISHYVGDQICGLFGLGATDPARACHGAIRAALGMVQAMDGLNDELVSSFGIRIKIGIGVHFGEAIVGEVGHPTLRRFTIIGNDVNTASRIESMTKELGATILVSRALEERLPQGALSVTSSTTVRLRGKRNDIELLSVDGFADPSPFAHAQHSIGRLLDDPAAFASKFYANMFAIRPELERLFVNGTTAQGEMLTHMLRSVVSGLESRKHAAVGLQTLGRKHVAYGVEPDHYSTFKVAMLKTIDDLLGASVTPVVKESWSVTLDVVLGLMKEGAGVDNNRR
jgi:class 3 adenylate cyclase/hemoglobin-like flavoprotein